MTKDEELKKEEEHLEKKELKEVREEERLAEEKLKHLKEEERLEEQRIEELKKEEERLEKGEHGGHEHEKKFTIIVNGQRKVVAKQELSFNEVVNLAYDNNPPSGPNIKFTITYRNGPRKNPEGDLIEGGIVEIKDGMIFNVTPTNQS